MAQFKQKGGNQMFRRKDSDYRCYECDIILGKDGGAILDMRDDEGIIKGSFILCHPCSDKIERYSRQEDGTLYLRNCARCGTIVAKDYQPCYVNEDPDQTFWLCLPCEKIVDREIAEEEAKKTPL